VVINWDVSPEIIHDLHPRDKPPVVSQGCARSSGLLSHELVFWYLLICGLAIEKLLPTNHSSHTTSFDLCRKQIIQLKRPLTQILLTTSYKANIQPTVGPNVRPVYRRLSGQWAGMLMRSPSSLVHVTFTLTPAGADVNYTCGLRLP